jgi:cell wall-associated NlpC family hydrolase
MHFKTLRRKALTVLVATLVSAPTASPVAAHEAEPLTSPAATALRVVGAAGQVRAAESRLDLLDSAAAEIHRRWDSVVESRQVAHDLFAAQGEVWDVMASVALGETDRVTKHQIVNQVRGDVADLVDEPLPRESIPLVATLGVASAQAMAAVERAEAMVSMPTTDAFVELRRAESDFDTAVADFATALAHALRRQPDEFLTSWDDVDPARIEVIAHGVALIGSRYEFAGKGPRVFDCSGFTSYVWRQVGVELPGYSLAQKQQTTALASAADLTVGDLVFHDRGPGAGRGRGHVSVWLGVGDLVVHSTPPAVALGSFQSKYLAGFGRVELAADAG